MGFKCQFCRKGFGHNTYVGYQLQGLAGCGKCDGEFRDLTELKNTLGYFHDLKNGIERTIKDNQIALAETDDAIQKLKEYMESKE